MQAPSRGKNPTTRGWNTHSLEVDDFRDGDNVGIIAGPMSAPPGFALVIIDLDSHAAVALAPGHLPPTGMIEGRPSKPRSHWYYDVPLDSVPESDWFTATNKAHPHMVTRYGHPGIRNRSFKDSQGKEVLALKTTATMCVAPPSKHPSGESREWDPFGELAVVTWPELLAAATSLAGAAGAVVGRGGTPTTTSSTHSHTRHA